MKRDPVTRHETDRVPRTITLKGPVYSPLAFRPCPRPKDVHFRCDDDVAKEA